MSLILEAHGDDYIQMSVNGQTKSPVDKHIFVGYLKKVLIQNTGILPPGVIWHSSSRQFWLYKTPARQIDITYRNQSIENLKDKTRTYELELYIPNTLTLVQVDSEYFPITTWVFGCNTLDIEKSTSIHTLLLPNHYKSGQVCYPENARTTAPPLYSIADALSYSWELTWSSPANKDIVDNLNYAVERNTPEKLFQNFKTPPTLYGVLKRWSYLDQQEVNGLAFLPPVDSISNPDSALGNWDNILYQVHDVINVCEHVDKATKHGASNFSFAINTAYNKALAKTKYAPPVTKVKTPDLSQNISKEALTELLAYFIDSPQNVTLPIA